MTLARRTEQVGYGPDSSGMICAYLFTPEHAPRALDSADSRHAAGAGRVERVIAVADDEKTLRMAVDRDHAARLADSDIEIGFPLAHPRQPRPRSSARAS